MTATGGPSPSTAGAAASARGALSRSLWRDVVNVGAIQVLVMIVTVARSKIVALVFGPAGVGVVSVIDQIVGLVTQIVSFSLPFAAVKFLSAAHSEGREPFSRLFGSFVWTLALLSAAGAAIACVLFYVWPSLLGRDLVMFGTAAIWACCTIPPTILTDFLATAIAAAGRGHASAFFGLWRMTAIAVLAGGGVFVGGLKGYYTGTLVAVVVVAAAGFEYIRRVEHAHMGSPAALRDLPRLRGVAGFAGALYVASFAQPAAILVARYAVVRSSGLAGAGMLQAAMALGLALFTVMRQPTAVWLVPRVNRRGPVEEKATAAAEFSGIYAVVVGAAALPFVLFPDLWLSALYSRQFLAAAPFAYLFVVAQMLKLFSGVPVALLVGLDEIAAQLVIALVGFAALAWLSWLLAPAMGFAGVAVAFLVEGLIAYVCSAWWLHRRFRIPPMGGTAAPVAVLLTTIAIGVVSARLPSASLGVLTVKATLCVSVAAAGAVWAFRKGLFGARAVPGSQLSE